MPNSIKIPFCKNSSIKALILGPYFVKGRILQENFLLVLLVESAIPTNWHSRVD